jgi:hypothetical protein
MDVQLPERLVEKLRILSRLTQQPVELLVAHVVELWFRDDQGPYHLLDTLCKDLMARWVSAADAKADRATVDALASEFLEAVDLRCRALVELRHHDGRTLAQIRQKVDTALADLQSFRANAMTLEEVKRVAADARNQVACRGEAKRALDDEKSTWELRVKLAIDANDDNLAKEALRRIGECERKLARIATERVLFQAHADLLEHGLSLIAAARP